MTRAGAPPGEGAAPTPTGAANEIASTAPTASTTVAHQVDVKRSLPDFVVWRWRREDDQLCSRGEHTYNQACPEHGCPWCSDEIDQYDCVKCDALREEEYPDPACKNGDDCLTCEQCYLPGLTTGTDTRCECTQPICRECGLCREHAQKPGGYRGRPGRGGYAVDEFGEPLWCEHSWRDPQTGLWT